MRESSLMRNAGKVCLLTVVLALGLAPIVNARVEKDEWLADPLRQFTYDRSKLEFIIKTTDNRQGVLDRITLYIKYLDGEKVYNWEKAEFMLRHDATEIVTHFPHAAVFSPKLFDPMPRKQGLGTLAYASLAFLANQLFPDYLIRSSTEASTAAKALWQRFVRYGFAEEIEDGFAFKTKEIKGWAGEAFREVATRMPDCDPTEYLQLLGSKSD